MKVTRVTKTEYETDDGEIHELPIELDEVPTVEQFQKTLDMWRELIEKEAVNKDVVAIYARVSSHEQKTKGDLDRQKGRILESCINLKYQAEYILCDVGSGMSSNRPRLKTLFNLVRERKINKVIVEHKDRLTRFHYGVFEEFFRSFNVQIEAIDDGKERTYEEELVNDMITLMSSFSSKIYGKRSAENRKQRKLAKMAAEISAKAIVK